MHPHTVLGVPFQGLSVDFNDWNNKARLIIQVKIEFIRQSKTEE